MPPASPSAAQASAAIQAKWGAMGKSDQLAVGGAAVLVIGYLLGIILEGWGLGLPSLLTIIGAIVVLVVILAGFAGVSGLSRTAILRVAAAVSAVYSLNDVGDMLANLNDWGALDIVLSAIVDVAAFVALVGVWMATSGDLVKDATGVLARGGRSMPGWLVALGSAVVLISWFVLELGEFNMLTDSALAMLAAVLALTVLWAGAGGAGQLRLPLPAGLVLAGLGVIAAILSLAWLIRILDVMDDASIFAWVGLVLYVGGAIVMAAGGLLGLQEERTAPSA
jgi:hypothetical protein